MGGEEGRSEEEEEEEEEEEGGGREGRFGEKNYDLGNITAKNKIFSFFHGACGTAVRKVVGKPFQAKFVFRPRIFLRYVSPKRMDEKKVEKAKETTPYEDDLTLAVTINIVLFSSLTPS
uniref:Uncharacterized protein n=1 Tax=Vespula pensylvanica TaxID=30213 RepID=A0A834UD20_VESPE|nr:hypothetical protein H0235_004597 [Vespula pensylvanica]